MRRLPVSIVLVVCLALATAGRSLQAQDGLREGLKVRISLPTGPRVTGVIQALTGDSIVLFAEPAASRVAVARRAARSIEVSQGRLASTGAKKGALWGGGVFGGLGTVFAIAAASDSDRTGNDFGPSPAVFALVTIVEGAGIGAIIGALVKAERWESVSVVPTAGVGPNGLRLGVRIW